MDLNDVKFGTDGIYALRGSERTCYVLTSHPDDGACLIAEFHDADGDIMSGELFTTEAYLLEPVAETVGVRVIDIQKVFYRQVEQAIDDSNWIPAEYTMNDVIDDICRFLKGEVA